MLMDSIVRNGKSDYTIVLPQNAGECLNYAAEELQSFIEQSTGAILPISVEDCINYTSQSCIISLGNTVIRSDHNLESDFESLNGDGFYLQTADSSLFICGAIDRGTLYGVYEFLERALKIKFYAADCTVVPKTTELKLNAMNIKQVPAFKYRAALQRSIYREDADKAYYARSRSSHDFIKIEERYGGQISWYTNRNNAHSSMLYVPKEKYFSTPEQMTENRYMYMFLEGNDQPSDICMTNGLTSDGKIDWSKKVSTIKSAIEVLKSFILDDPTAEYYMFGQMDHTTHCKCEKCAELTKKYNFSGIIIRFVNALVEEVQKWADMQPQLTGKQINVVTFAYLYSEAPPTIIDTATGKYQPIDDTVKPHKNLVIRFAPFRLDKYYAMDDPLQHNDKSLNNLEGWRDICGRLMVWDYGCNFSEYYTYCPVLRRVKSDIKRYKNAGAFYYMMQLCATEFNEFQTDIRGYVLRKLMWDTDLEPLALRTEFIKGYYGPVADNVNAVINAMDKLYEDNQQKLNGRFFFESLTNPCYNPLSFWEEILKILDNGIIKADKNIEYVKRLNRVKLVPLYVMLVNRDTYFTSDALRHRFITEEFFALCEQLNVVEYGEGLKIQKLCEKYPI